MSSEERVEIPINGGEDSELLGKKFKSFLEVQKFIYNLEVQSRQKFAVYDSKRISSVRSKGVKRYLKPEIIYYSITYACIHGGRKFKSRSKGVRQSSTHKMGCPFKIKFSASTDGHHLEIVKCSANHVGHGLSEKVYDHLPQVRRLNEEDVKEVKQFLEENSNIKLLQNKLLLDKGKKVTLKDLNNIKYKCKKEGDDLLKAVKFLEEEYEANISLLGDTMETFRGLYFSTEDMRRSMLAFPEIVFLDGSYKLPNGSTLMLVVVEDANGLSEVVGVCLLGDDDYETFSWFLARFKEDCEAASDSIKCFMTDKDLFQRDVINEIFVDVPVYICNRLESLSQKIEAVVPPNNSLSVFLKHFLNWLATYNEEINSKVAKIILKKKVTKFDDNSCEKKYMDLLTPYAYSYVLRQFALSKKVTLIEDRGVFEVKTKEGTIMVNTFTCDCSDFVSMLLPCRHILCLRRHLNLPLYCEDICNKRWLKENYLKSCRIKLGEVENVPPASSCVDMSANRPRFLDPAEKRKLANRIATNLVNLVCSSSDSLFYYKLDCLKEIEMSWRRGCEVQVIKIDMHEDQIMQMMGESDCEDDEVAEEEMIDGTIIDQNQVQSMSSDMSHEDQTMDEFDCDETDDRKISDENQAPSIPIATKRKKRGRARGSTSLWSELTVIGLKKKRKINTPTAFALKQDEIKKEQILKEIVSDGVGGLIKSCLKGERKITSLDIKQVEQMSHCLLSPEVDLRLVEDYFEPIAFMSVKQKIESLEESSHVWCCAACSDELCELKSISCDSCLKWYHFLCAGISKVPDTKTWFCSECL